MANFKHKIISLDPFLLFSLATKRILTVATRELGYSSTFHVCLLRPCLHKTLAAQLLLSSLLVLVYTCVTAWLFSDAGCAVVMNMSVTLLWHSNLYSGQNFGNSVLRMVKKF